MNSDRATDYIPEKVNPFIPINVVLTRLAASRIVTSDEDSVQRGIAQALTDSGIAFEREVALDMRDRIDFLIGDVGLEVKVAGSAAEVHRQLERYSKHDRIKSLVLVSSKAKHCQIAGVSNGKPFLNVTLWGAIL